MQKRITFKQLKRIVLESTRIVKEGAGAWYDISIEDLRIEKPTSVKETDEEGVYEFTAPIVLGVYTVQAQSYDEQYFPQEDGDDWIKIDGGTITEIMSATDEESVTEYFPLILDVEATYGGGSSHVYLPEDGKITLKDLDYSDNYVDLDVIKLDSTDMAEKINTGYAATKY